MYPKASGDIGVHGCAADVFAALLDDEHIDLVERQRRHERLCVVEQLAFGVTAHLVGGEAFDPNNLAGGRLDSGNATQQSTG